MNDRQAVAVGLLHRGLDRMGIRADETAVQLLGRYCLELEKWNRKINLIAKNTTLDDIVEKHFLDSLTLVPVLDGFEAGNLSLLDVGSGAGFPGLAVKTIRPELVVTLLEPRQRRAAFLRHIIRTLRLRNISVAAFRTDEGRLAEACFDVIAGRAVADVPEFLAMVSGIASRETQVICMQGEQGRRNWREGSEEGDYVCTGLVLTRLPFSGVQRYLLIFSKKL